MYTTFSLYMEGCGPSGAYACMHVCMYACMYVGMYVCMYVCMHACMYPYIHIDTYRAHRGGLNWIVGQQAGPRLKRA